MCSHLESSFNFFKSVAVLVKKTCAINACPHAVGNMLQNDICDTFSYSKRVLAARQTVQACCCKWKVKQICIVNQF